MRSTSWTTETNHTFFLRPLDYVYAMDYVHSLINPSPFVGVGASTKVTWRQRALDTGDGGRLWDGGLVYFGRETSAEGRNNRLHQGWCHAPLCLAGWCERSPAWTSTWGWACTRETCSAESLACASGSLTCGHMTSPWPITWSLADCLGKRKEHLHIFFTFFM